MCIVKAETRGIALGFFRVTIIRNVSDLFAILRKEELIRNNGCLVICNILSVQMSYSYSSFDINVIQDNIIVEKSF